MHSASRMSGARCGVCMRSRAKLVASRNLLPRTAPSLPGFQLEAECVPAGAVGGDWYDYIPLNEGRVAILLADVSGKGMPAAVLMSAVRAVVRFWAPLPTGHGGLLPRVHPRP